MRYAEVAESVRKLIGEPLDTEGLRCAFKPAQNHAILLAPLPRFGGFLGNTRAVPLVRKENAHKGRVFFALILGRARGEPQYECERFKKDEG